MTLNLIGIGYKKEDITFEQLKIIKKSKNVFLEYYTSFYEDDFNSLENFLNKKIEILKREDIEILIEEKVLEKAKKDEVSLLILGDPLIATTHSDLLLRCDEIKIKTKIYNNISVLNLVGKTGLNLYKFGKITSIPFYNEKFMPKTPFNYFLENSKINSHTLFLLDLKPDENKYLSISNALNFLLEIQKDEKEEKNILIDENTKVVACSKLGFKDEKIIFSKLKNIIEFDKKNNLEPPICIIIPSLMNEIEEEYLKKFELR